VASPVVGPTHLQTLIAEPLDAAAFAPFGFLVSAGLGAGHSANQGTATRFDFCAELESTRPLARPNLAVFRSAARPLPVTIRLLEQHPCSTQTFLPMVCSRFLVVVAPSGTDGAPHLAGLRAFIARAGQGITYRRGVWHHPIIALDADADFAMLAWEDGSVDDCVEWPLPAGAPIAVSCPGPDDGGGTAGT
jgi:ureidoglycolate lyase